MLVPPERLRDLLIRPQTMVVAFVGVLLRWWTLMTPVGIMNGDEAVTGLSALEISQGHFGLLIPESYYTVLVESYLFAPFVQVFGTHIVPLKLMGIVLWFAASLTAMAIGRRLAGPTAAVLAFAVFWLVPGALMELSTRAYLGYAGGLFVGLLALLGLVRVVQDGLTRRRALTTGALIGLVFMMHPILPGGLGPAALVVTWRHRRSWREWHLPAGVGFLLGCSPWLAWNLANNFASFKEKDVDDSTYVERVRGYFAGLFPRDLGLMDRGGVWLHGGLSVVIYLVLLVFIAAAVVFLLRRDAASRVIAVPAIVSWFLLGVFKHSSFVDDGRYGILPVPYALLSLAIAAGALFDRRRPVDGAGRVWPRAAVGAALLWGAVLVLPYQLEVFGTKLGDPNAVNASIVRELDARGIELLAGEYFVVLPVSYESGGRIATRVLFPLPRRYPRLEARVLQGAPNEVAFVFYAGQVRESELLMAMDRYDQIALPGLELWIPRQDGA